MAGRARARGPKRGPAEALRAAVAKNQCTLSSMFGSPVGSPPSQPRQSEQARQSEQLRQSEQPRQSNANEGSEIKGAATSPGSAGLG